MAQPVPWLTDLGQVIYNPRPQHAIVLYYAATLSQD